MLAAPPGSTAVLNAANEVAVEAFLAGQIRFDQIHAVNAGALGALVISPPESLEELLELDARARSKAQDLVRGIGL